MADEDIQIRVKVDEQGAIGVFNQLGSKLGEVQSKGEAVGGGFSRLQANIISLNSAVGLVKDAFGALSGAYSTVTGALQRGAQIDDVASAFEKLSAQAGSTADVFKSQLREATANTIDDFSLMQKANESLRAGMKPDEYIAVTKAARALAEETGGNLTQEIDDLSRAFLTGNDRLLKLKGIYIDTEKAQADYARSLGIEREQLSELGIQRANQQGILEAYNKKLAESGDIALDAGDRVDIMASKLQNAKDEMLKSVSSSTELNEALDKLIKIAAKADFSIITGALTKVTKAAADAVTVLSALGDATELFGRTAKIMAGSTLSFEDALKAARASLVAETTATKTAASAWSDYRTEALSVLGTQEKLTSELEDGYQTVIPQVEEHTKRTNEQTAGLIKSVEGIKKQTEALKDNVKTQKEMPMFGPGNDAGYSEAFQQQERMHEDAAREAMQQEADFNASLVQMANNALAVVTDEITNAIVGNDKQKAKNAALGSKIGGIFGEYGAMLGSVVGSLFGGGDGKGTVARKTADKFFADIFDANRLAVIIDDQLVELNDLVFKGDTLFGGSDFKDGSFSAMFNSLPDAARAAFGGVGAAFEELIGVSEDMGGQLGAIFANNIGGSLNNLQLLVESTGKSFEELRDAVVEAFLDGKLSALEAQTALNGIAQVSQKGIPDGIGMVEQAFKNLETAGKKGGRALIDALQDVGYEARELGITDFAELERYMKEKMPENAEAITLMFEAMRTNGVDSIQELTDATAEGLLPILSQLEAMNFPFAEEAKTVDEMLTKLNELDKKKIETDITLNVRTNMDDNTRAMVRQGADYSNLTLGQREGQTN